MTTTPEPVRSMYELMEQRELKTARIEVLQDTIDRDPFNLNAALERDKLADELNEIIQEIERRTSI